jgi:hypothetical protein
MECIFACVILKFVLELLIMGACQGKERKRPVLFLLECPCGCRSNVGKLTFQ